MDSRVEQIFRETMRGDTSFQDKETFLSIMFPSKYSKMDMRETWDSGIKHGIEIGLRKASLEGQRIELLANLEDSRQKEFVEKFYKLAAEYECAVQYHQEHGMIIIDRHNDINDY